MLTQIYEIATPEEAASISAIGVDHIGVLVGDGQFPREQPVASAARIAAAITPPSRFVALFLTSDVARIGAWSRELHPAIIHLGASADLLAPADVAALRRKVPGSVIMRSVPVSGEGSIGIARSYEGFADYLLLDSYRS